MKRALERYFESYADYHRHPMNQLTHKVAIPLIVFHVIAMLDWVPLARLPGFTLTLAHPIYLGVVAWYATLHARLALVMAVGYAVCFPLGWITPWPAVVALAAFAWLIQLAGHVVWEKRQPAFLTNLVQALIGPLFFAAILMREWPIKQAAND
jgi:uncharacterized membrane protein YGL010W